MAKKIMMISGARPEIIKLVLLYHTVKAQDWAQVCWSHTGQYAVMATDLLVCCHSQPDYQLQRRSAGLFAILSERYPDVCIFLPAHLNPTVRGTMHEILNNRPNVILAETFDYLEMRQTLPGAWRVMTDSDGLQDEASPYGVPLRVLREEAEPSEALGSGYARSGKIIETSLLES